VTRRTWIFVGVGAILGAAVGLFYVTTFDVLYMCPGIPGPCAGTHDEIFGWQPGSLAVPIWTVIGLVGGGLVGWVTAGPMTPIRWLLIVIRRRRCCDHLLPLGVHAERAGHSASLFPSGR
jgi:hypothetical protein